LPILEVRILQPVVRVRFSGNPQNPDTLRETEVCFLGEDGAGNFILVALDSDLNSNPREWAPMIEGRWLSVLGARVKISGLYPQDRTVARRSAHLYSLCNVFRKPKQRFYYTLKAYHCTRMKILDNPTTKPSFLTLAEALEAGSGMRKIERFNLICVMLYKNDKNILVHDEAQPATNFTKIITIKYAMDAYVPRLEDCPCLLELFGVLWEPASELTLDQFSGCVLRQRRTNFSFAEAGPQLNMAEQLPSPDHTLFKNEDNPAGNVISGTLVRLVGQVEEINPVECIQWLSCRECFGERILTLDGLECDQCRSTNIKNNLRLVVRIGSSWVELLEETARGLLAKKINTAGDTDENSRRQEHCQPKNEDLERDPDLEEALDHDDDEMFEAQVILGKPVSLIVAQLHPFWREIRII